MFSKKIFILILLLVCHLSSAKTNLNFNAQFVANAKKAGLFNANKFDHLINGMRRLNVNIPKANKNFLRVVTYNVHSFKNALNKYTGKDIYRVLRNINADVLVLQEVLDNDRTIFALQKSGYRYKIFAPIDTSRHFGNMILSKYPFKRKQASNFRNNNAIKTKKLRSYLKVEIDLSRFNKKNLIIYGTHLAIYSQVPVHNSKNRAPDEKIRTDEIKEFLWRIKHEDKNKNVIIAADFNASRTGTALTTLSNAGFKDNFTAEKVAVPIFTNLHGGAIDFIFSRFVDLKNAGSYIYYTSASDHLPVIADIQLRTSQKKHSRS
jgi:endonuclease/exonuclease/phosphatase family metal-dependent hydrolase